MDFVNEGEGGRGERGVECKNYYYNLIVMCAQVPLKGPRNPLRICLIGTPASGKRTQVIIEIFVSLFIVYFIFMHT
jgi:hypothetical protein